jgi:tetratricopeptide (TPR) repeat protein
MKKNMTGLFTVMVIWMSLLMQVQALIGNTEVTETYLYDRFGYPVHSPAAYVPEKIIDHRLLDLPMALQPNDLFVDGKGNLYITDDASDSIICIDMNDEILFVINKLSGVTSGKADVLNNPESVFVTEGGLIYIADTGNGRVIAVDRASQVVKEFPTPDFSVKGEKKEYKPSKIVVDRAGRIYVVARDINRGMLELDADGNFRTFFGAPKVIPNMADLFWRVIATESQRRKYERFVPTEYNNAFVDESGFVYGTIGTVNKDSIYAAARAGVHESNLTDAVPIRKINPAGDDILAKKGFYPPLGDLDFERGDHSTIADVCVLPDGTYSLLDTNKKRVFTYDAESNLLYIFGGEGTQFGKFSNPVSLVYWNGKMAVADKATGYITTFLSTEYAKRINQANQLTYNGKYEEAAVTWKEALKYNSNLDVAYYGIGKTLYRQKQYAEAQKYLKVIEEKYYYSKCVEMLRKETLAKLIPYITSMFGIVFIAAIAYAISGSRKGGR